MARKDYLRFLSEMGGKHLVDDVKATEKIQQRYAKKYNVKKRSSSWRGVGAVQRVIPYERGIRLSCQGGWVELHWIAVDCLRVRLHRDSHDFIEPFSYSLHKVDWPAVPFEFVEGDKALEMRSSSVVCRVGKQPFRIGLETSNQQPLCLDMAGMQFRDEGGVRLSMVMLPDESSYGLGERAYSLMLRGKKFQLWNAEGTSNEHHIDPLYYSIPFYLGVHQNGAYGVFWDNSSRGMADLGASKHEELVFEAETGELRYYLFVGNDVNSVLSRYTELTGHIQLPPLWGLGYHQSRPGHESQEAVLKTAQEFRAREIACDALYLDMQHMEGFQPFTWDQRRFLQIKQLINSLHDNGFKVIASLRPGIKIDTDFPVYQSGLERDVFLKYPDGQLVSGADWAGACNFPDFTNPAARAWWVELVSRFITVGVDGLVNDMGEPSVFTSEGAGTLPDCVVHNEDGLGGNHLTDHNIYGTLMGKGSRDGLRKQRPEIRPFNLIRAGFAGAQRYANSWLGENTSDWEHLRLSVSMALNMGLSGAPMTGADVGGFHKDTNGELFTRWLQAASLMPLFRSNTAIGTHPQEPWSFGQPYEVINRLTIALRYRLMPYLYSVVAQCKEYGWPIMRPVFMAEPANRALRTVGDCYLLGDALLVAPVLTPNTMKRSVYLPVGQWYDYWTGEFLEGGQTVTVPAPLERLPLFVRAGAVLPHWPEMTSTSEKEVETLVYRVYPGEFETVLYEDRGEGLDYEKGDYRWIYVSAGWEENRFIINRRIAGQYTPSYRDIKLEVIGFDDEPVRVRVDRQGAPLWFYDDGLLELTIDDFQRVEITRKSLPTDATVMRRPW